MQAHSLSAAGEVPVHGVGVVLRMVVRVQRVGGEVGPSAGRGRGQFRHLVCAVVARLRVAL